MMSSVLKKADKLNLSLSLILICKLNIFWKFKMVNKTLGFNSALQVLNYENKKSISWQF